MIQSFLKKKIEIKDIKLSEKSTLRYSPFYININKNELDFLFNECPTYKHKIKIYNKEVEIPRFQQAYGKDYPYSGTVSKSKEMPDVIVKIKNIISKLYPDIDFNMCLVNWYLTGDDYISFHADDENVFHENTPVVGVTFCYGESRKLKIKVKDTKETVANVRLTNGSLYVMEGNFQKEFLHGVPKQKKCGKRISLTFRSFI